MIRALAIKELRESAGLAALAALGMAWAVLRLVGYNMGSQFFQMLFGYYAYQEDHFAFLNDDFTTKAVIFVGALAVALGLKQTAWEHGRNTFHFLLHRPISRWQVVATKLAVGMILVIVILAAAILLYGWWTATPGNRAVPFEWSMTLDAWKLALTLPLVYIGSFLSGMRPGHWFGTRLFPLTAAILLAVLASVSPLWWLTTPLLLVGYTAALIAVLYYTEIRDY